MQHDHVLEKLSFDLLTPHPRVLGGGGGGLCEKIVAASMIPFNLICNMTML